MIGVWVRVDGGAGGRRWNRGGRPRHLTHATLTERVVDYDKWRLNRERWLNIVGYARLCLLRNIQYKKQLIFRDLHPRKWERCRDDFLRGHHCPVQELTLIVSIFPSSHIKERNLELSQERNLCNGILRSHCSYFWLNQFKPQLTCASTPVLLIGIVRGR